MKPVVMCCIILSIAASGAERRCWKYWRRPGIKTVIVRGSEDEEKQGRHIINQRIIVYNLFIRTCR